MAEVKKPTLADRMDGDYQPPILAEPKGGPIPGSKPTDVDAQALQDQWAKAKADLLKKWPATAQPMVDELAGQAETALANNDVGSLGSLAVSAGVLAAVSLVLTGAGSALAVAAASGVIAEAAAQDVDVKTPSKPGAERVRQTADAVAGVIASGYASGAARTALQLAGAKPAEVRAAVAAHLNDLGATASGLVADNIGPLLASAQYAGRLAVLEAHPAGSYVAVEANDGPSRCQPCAKIDGTSYGTLAEGLADYPNAGGTYRHCEGRDHCHGHLRPVWAVTAAG